MKRYRCRHLYCVDRPPIQDGSVLVDAGQIVAVGPSAEIESDLPRGTETIERMDHLILPGLVNAHTHVELSWMQDAELDTTSYVKWVSSLLIARATYSADPSEPARRALREMHTWGTVAIGDIANELWVTSLLSSSSLEGILFHELIALDPAQAEKTLADALTQRDGAESLPAQPSWRLALTPHAPHTCSPHLLRALAGRAETVGAPLAIHVAESREEFALLQSGSGAMAELLAERNQLPPDWNAPARTPVAYLKRLGLLSERTLAVHCVQITPEDRRLLQSSQATVVTCPRSNRHLDVGVCPVPELLREGVPIALGTDSLASNHDVNLFAELAALLGQHPSISPAAALRIATLNGAKALRMDRRWGSLTPGKRGTCLALPINDGDESPLESLRELTAPPERLEEAGR